MKLLYDVLRRCILYLNRCVAASSAAVVGARRDSVPFSLKPILVNMEGGRYVGPILPGPLMELLTGRQATCDRPQAAAAAVSVVAGAEVLATAVAVAAVAEAAGNLSLGWEMMGGGREGAVAERCTPACSVPSGQGGLADPPGGYGPPQPARPRSLQELALVQGVLGGMRA